MNAPPSTDGILSSFAHPHCRECDGQGQFFADIPGHPARVVCHCVPNYALKLSHDAELREEARRREARRSGSDVPVFVAALIGTIVVVGVILGWKS